MRLVGLFLILIAALALPAGVALGEEPGYQAPPQAVNPAGVGSPDAAGDPTVVGGGPRATLSPKRPAATVRTCVLQGRVRTCRFHRGVAHREGVRQAPGHEGPLHRGRGRHRPHARRFRAGAGARRRPVLPPRPVDQPGALRRLVLRRPDRAGALPDRRALPLRQRPAAAGLLGRRHDRDPGQHHRLAGPAHEPPRGLERHRELRPAGMAAGRQWARLGHPGHRPRRARALPRPVHGHVHGPRGDHARARGADPRGRLPRLGHLPHPRPLLRIRPVLLRRPLRLLAARTRPRTASTRGPGSTSPPR